MSKTKEKTKEMAKKMRSNESGASGAKPAPKNESVPYKDNEPTNEAGGNSGAGSDRKERKYKLPKGSENKR
jgi:hypothetical protein